MEELELDFGHTTTPPRFKFNSKEGLIRLWNENSQLGFRETIIRNLDKILMEPKERYDFLNIVFRELDTFFPGSLEERELSEIIHHVIGKATIEIYLKFLEESRLEIRLDDNVPYCRSYSGTDIYFHLFIVYLGYAADETKIGLEIRIKKILKIIVDKGQISKWREDIRKDLARALVANNLFEECVNYRIFEAMEFLKRLACCNIQDVYGKKIWREGTERWADKNFLEALKTNHNPHAWSALLRLMAMKGDIDFIEVLDSAEPSNFIEKKIKRALIFKNPTFSGI